ncbi:hypothetical protein EVAR_40506_1 [Eumeta japonica]|uniref:Uncharacterized protein n=1 Tax=Eumeta variegata TaxID=151549 RepID=A0A4C1XZY8_EUMVA|nr:hypothetical protein EVAR_40506_1 [Eumeta japonica]
MSCVCSCCAFEPRPIPLGSTAALCHEEEVRLRAPVFNAPFHNNLIIFSKYIRSTARRRHDSGLFLFKPIRPLTLKITEHAPYRFYEIGVTSLIKYSVDAVQVFHLHDIRWERPRFLSKSFLAFVTFNVISYSLLAAEVLTTNVADTSAEKKVSVYLDVRVEPQIQILIVSFYQHVFNGCYAVLLFIVVIFFLIYGVEVYFKVTTDNSPTADRPSDAGRRDC